MSRDPIDKKQIPLLWGKAAGCCELCSTPVYEEGLLRQTGNYTNIAHINAASKLGPRYDPNQTTEERGSIDNLMLVCRSCHKLIDDNPKEFPATDLRARKLEREDKVALLMQGLRPERCTVVEYLVSFGSSAFSLSDTDWKRALFSRRLAYNGLRPFDLNNSKDDARNTTDFSLLACNLEKRVAAFRECGYEPGPIAVFALAPQPLLIKLGSLLGDETELVIFQRSRSREGWCGSDTEEKLSFNLEVPSSTEDATEAIIILSASGRINRDSLPCNNDFMKLPTYEIVLSHLSVDAADSPCTSEKFRSFSADALYRIHQEHPEVRTLHIFPAMPASLNVVFGAALNTSIIPKYIVYEKHDGKFSKSLTIGASK